MNRTKTTRWWIIIPVVLVLLVGGGLAADRLRLPEALYREAQNAPPWRAAMLYRRLADELPQVVEYFELEQARCAMPAVEAVGALRDIIATRPHSPAAYEAHLILARYYAASGQDEQAEEAYRAALALEESPALQAELARYLADVGDGEGAYDLYRRLLSEYPDAFTAMRLYGGDPVQVAADLSAAGYYSDALEALRGVESEETILLRAGALNGLGRYEEAAEQYRAWLTLNPDDGDAQMALAGLGQSDEARELYEGLDLPAAQVALADLLVDEDPDAALALYRESDDPIAWWKAAGLLEANNRQRDALNLYAQVARSGIYLADDAAYRMFILARQRSDARAEREAQALLAAQGTTYLGLQAQEGELWLPVAPDYYPNPDWLLDKVNALESLDLDVTARRELEMAARFDPRPEVVAAAAQALAERGEVTQAYALAVALLDDDLRRPFAVWRLAYPKPYAEQVMTAAEAAGVDPLLVWAVMRQESRFDPEARSFANAQGLMQVVPGTRDEIAGRLGEEVRLDAMFDPDTAIRFGVAYLGSLLEGYEGDVELAVAAYNGGPGSVLLWLDDPLVETRDDFYRWIGFGETREYLMRVMLNYRIYQYLEEMKAGGGAAASSG